MRKNRLIANALDRARARLTAPVSLYRNHPGSATALLLLAARGVLAQLLAIACLARLVKGDLRALVWLGLAALAIRYARSNREEYQLALADAGGPSPLTGARALLLPLLCVGVLAAFAVIPA